MAEITIALARLVRARNRMSARMDELRDQVKENNSVPEGQVQLDVKHIMCEYELIRDRFVELTTLRHLANTMIAREFAALKELRKQRGWLKKLSTTSGNVVGRMLTTTTKYVALIDRAEQDAAIRDLDRQIHALESVIDHHTGAFNLTLDEALIAGF